MANLLAVPALTATLPEVVSVKVPLANLIVIVWAMLYDRSVKVATPWTAVRLVVPCKAPLPAMRLAVTTVVLSLVTKLPAESSTRTTGWLVKATPAVAFGEG